MSVLRPILFIWFAFALSILGLLVHLKVIAFGSSQTLMLAIATTLLVSITFITSWLRRSSVLILQGIETWEKSLQRDVRQFLRRKKTSLLLSLMFLVLTFGLVVISFFASRPKMLHEFSLYIYLITLFHVSLVVTFTFFKISRTVLWVLHENQIEKMEKAKE